MIKKKAFYIILLCMCIFTLSGCNSIYKALSNGTEKVLEVASDTVGDAPKNAALDVFLVVLILKGKTEVIYPLPVLYKLIAERLKYSGFPEVKNQLS